jgi:predicted acyltransferase
MRSGGITLTDLVFPFFLFIVSVPITLAYTRRLEARVEDEPCRKIASRAVKIVLLGWLLALWPTFDLPMGTWACATISIVFLVCAVIFLNTS